MSGGSVVVDRENRAPEFKDTNGKVITSDNRSIAENSEADADASVGDPVTAIDPNGASDTPEGALTYTLGGSDKSSFAISSTDGQITVKAGTKLDYEGKKVYRVTVTATDPSQASATIDITINVTDENEPPVIAGDEEIDREFVENSPSTVHTFRATDPERRSVYWSLSTESTDNEDVEQFSISSNGGPQLQEGPRLRESQRQEQRQGQRLQGDRGGLGRRTWRGESDGVYEESHSQRHQQEREQEHHHKQGRSPGRRCHFSHPDRRRCGR